MPAKISTHVFKGMQKDINVANASNEYLFDAYNIRFNQLDDNTLMSIVNEKGNEDIMTIGAQSEKYVSHYVVDNHIVVFTCIESTSNNVTTYTNSIYRIDVSESSAPIKNTLYSGGDLEIRPEHPLEFTSYYEAEGVIKIYWVDGVNQLRFMNIMVNTPYTSANDFNTTPILRLAEEVTVELIDGNGLFPAGVIQYALTYVNKLGAESNIFYTTKLKSILFKNRAASPQEYINCAFQITVNNVDTSFDYIRCYQLLRTSLDAQPTCLLLNEVSIEGLTGNSASVTIIDTNSGSSYDPTYLLFQKYPIVPLTIDLKSNTLFLGNLNELKLELSNGVCATIRNFFKSLLGFTNATIASGDKQKYSIDGTFNYKYNADADVIRTFKSGEVYRIGVLFLDEYGVWTLPVYIDDIPVNCKQASNGDTMLPICFKYTYNGSTIPSEISGYKRFRFLMVNPSAGDRSILALGLVTPTMYELSDRIFNTPHTYSSWFARPFNSNVTNKQNALVPAGSGYEAEIQARVLAGDIQPSLKHYNDSARAWYTDSALYDSIYADDDAFEDISSPADMEFRLRFHIYGTPNPTIYIKLEFCNITKGSLGLINNVISSDSGIDVGTGFSADHYTNFVNGTTYLEDSLHPNTIYSYIMGVAGIVDHYATNHSPSGFSKFVSNNPSIETQLTQALNSIALKEGELTGADDIEFTTTFVIHTPNVKFDDNEYVVNKGDISAFDFGAGLLSEFRIDHSVLNLYSPDIDNQYYEIHNNDALTLNLIGYSKVQGILDSVFVQLKNAGSSVSSTISPYFNFSKKETDTLFYFTRAIFDDTLVWKRIKDGETTIMRDCAICDLTTYTNIDFDHDGRWEAVTQHKVPTYTFPIYPWHGAGSLNNEDNTEGENRSATYQKIFAKQWNCDNTIFYDIPYVYREHQAGENWLTKNVSGCKVDRCFVSNVTNSITMIKQNNASKTYIGNPDIARTYVKLLNGIGTKENPIEFGYDMYLIYNNQFMPLDERWIYTDLTDSSGNKNAGYIFNPNETTYSRRYPTSTNDHGMGMPLIHKVDPIQIKYNTGTHVIIPIDRTEYIDSNHKTFWILSTLPRLSDNDRLIDNTNTVTDDCYYWPLWDNLKNYWDKIFQVFDENNTAVTCSDKSYFHIGEIVRTGEVIRYNGEIWLNSYSSYDKNNPVLLSSVFIPIMESEPIDSVSNTVISTYGDTWYGRWDCFKTLHKTDLDELSVHDYVSIMIESHINLNGRYDSYRNFYDQTLVNAVNSNKFNDVYSQMDTFWSYKVTPNYLNTTNYPNQITWSLTKQVGSLVDAWTRITAANVEQLDGTKGVIRRIINYNDSLLVFQDRCISLIKYNELTQITTTEGVPVEISNSQKVTGIVKIYDGIGCVNKWSIASDANGVFFIDNVNENIMWLSGNQLNPIVNLSGSNSFNLFMKANNSFAVWNPKEFSNFVTFIDSSRKDVYFVSKDKCLCYSLALQAFTSFYSYEGTYGMFNINNNFYSLYSELNTSSDVYDRLKLYRNFTGLYNKIYLNYKDTYFTFIDHGESFLTDKTFTNINYILDAYDVSLNASDTIEDYDGVDYNYEKNITFNKLRVWTPFLDTGDITLTPNEDLQRKFRTWGILIQRDLKYNNTSVDRIRNNWAKFKFTFTQPDENKDIKIELMNINILSIE